jgi:hypothetical protein
MGTKPVSEFKPTRLSRWVDLKSPQPEMVAFVALAFLPGVRQDAQECVKC